LFPAGTHPQYFYTYLSRKYSLPDVWYVDLWPIGPQQVVITGPDAAAQVTAIRSYPMHPEVNRFLAPMIGDNVIAATNGPLWKKLHHMMAPAFTPRYVKTLLSTIADEVMLFHGRLRELAKAGDVFSMEEELSKLSFDVIGGIVFGVSSGLILLADLYRAVTGKLSDEELVMVKESEEQEELERAGRFPTCETNMRVWVVVGRREGVGRTVDARAQPVSRRPAWATSTSDGGSRGGARQ